MPMLFYCMIAALFLGSWPLIAKFSQLKPGWISFMVTLGALPIVVLGILQRDSFPTGKQIMIGCLSGIVAGCGLLFYGKLIGWQGVEISRALPITSAMFPVVTAVGAFIIFDEPFTLSKVLGLGSVALAVYLLN